MSIAQPTQLIEDAIRAQFPTLGYNAETGSKIMDGLPFNDGHFALIRKYIRDNISRSMSAFDDALELAARANVVRPIHDTLYSLRDEYDGGSYIKQLAACFHVKNDPIGGKPAAEVWLRRWLIGAVQRVLDVNHDPNHVLLLIGKQGAGKSYFTRWLSSILPRAYSDAKIDLEHKDALIALSRTFVQELAEFDKVINSKDASAVKSFLTSREMVVRLPYGREPVNLIPLTSFIGTTNSDQPLKDPTGNRRYLTLNVEGIDRSYTQINIRKLWAEAVNAYYSGERADLQPDEYEAQVRMNAEAEEYTSVDELLDLYFVATLSNDDKMSMNEIRQVLDTRDVSVSFTRAVEMDIGKALRRKGVEKKTARHLGVLGKFWVGLRPRLPNEIDMPDGTTQIKKKPFQNAEIVVGEYPVIEDAPIEPADNVELPSDSKYYSKAVVKGSYRFAVLTREGDRVETYFKTHDELTLFFKNRPRNNLSL